MALSRTRKDELEVEAEDIYENIVASVHEELEQLADSEFAPDACTYIEKSVLAKLSEYIRERKEDLRRRG